MLFDDSRPPVTIFQTRTHTCAQLGLIAAMLACLLARWGSFDRPAAALAGMLALLALGGMLALAVSGHAAARPRTGAAARLRAQAGSWRLPMACCCGLAAALAIGANGQMTSPLCGPFLVALALATLSRGTREIDLGAGAAIGALIMIPLDPARAFSAVQFALATLALAALMRTLERMLARSREEADIDPLTKVLNSAAFARAAAGRLLSARHDSAWGVVMIDLDDFGLLNKRSGHLAGDRLLCSAVQRLRHAFGQEGIVGRLGGDEFAALVPAERAQELGGDVLRALLAQPEPISASIGVACSHHERGDWVALLREADVALRAAKRDGKSKAVVFADGIDAEEQIKRRHVREAIDSDAIQIVVQPIVDLAAGRIHAFEVLSRFVGIEPSDAAHPAGPGCPVRLTPPARVAPSTRLTPPARRSGWRWPSRWACESSSNRPACGARCSCSRICPRAPSSRSTSRPPRCTTRARARCCAKALRSG